ncbi:MAG: alpha/beta fold hydrolase [Saprospiraceae bacterium]
MTITNTIRLSTVIFLFLSLLGCKSLDPKRMKVYNEITSQVMRETLPNLEVGQSAVANSGEIKIWYELIETSEESAKGTVLLIEGLAGTAMGWGDYSYQPFLTAGLNVIRMDNREVGRSTWTKDLGYDLLDMAEDVLAVINDANLDAVHLVGQSMGGMIAQEFALNYPEKVSTLSLIYTSANIDDESIPGPSKAFINDIIAAYSTYRKDDITSQIKLELASMDASNAGPLARPDLLFIAQRTRYEIERRRGKNKQATDVQQMAITKSGSRKDRLHQLKIPTLIIHGEKDPLIPIEHGKELARLIPHAKTVWAEEYGHNIPTGFSEVITKEIIRLIE